MIHIAICDDNISDTEHIEKQLRQLESCLSINIDIQIFYSGESFCKSINKSCPFDIVLMDIEMDGIDGIVAGEKLRADDENDRVLLIYISSHENYYRRLFDVQPFSFMQKPIDANEFYDKLNKAIEKIIKRRKNGKSNILPISQKGKEILIPMNNILYLESKVRLIHLFTTDGMIIYYGTLSKEEKKLTQYEFVRTHQSYIVNLQYIKIVTSNNLTLINDMLIPISSNRKNLVKERYMEYRRNLF
ncbi:LytR/AlgR family response regulator transcription factor [Vallitalea guaymasensis]|uniref:Stage 0 sporulation protein A homolog n=1 Tax=Vallitalea guaymasensis TaxID=1185412 RepID=A0A8J8SBI4_9FIRM|nr:LytTR family DNA-binding domain-containing protein [Vallitalea guaymasensis]QUH28450.1 response regulator transcription factor [Vallitalea guaymasensis]